MATTNFGHVVFVLDDSNREITRTATWEEAHTLCEQHNSQEGTRWSFTTPIEYEWLCNEQEA